MKHRILILALVLALVGCSNLTMQCSGTYTGEEVRNGAGK